MTAAQWHRDAVFYHIYPLGFCGNHGFRMIRENIPHLQYLGINTVYLGPVFASAHHGYDTSDYFRIDARLGTEQEFRELVEQLHAAGIRVVLDGVFNHVGREFWAFRQLQLEGSRSEYRHWFRGIDFSHSSPEGDAFTYDGWEGHYDLVTLNLDHPPVREHLLHAVTWMIESLGIDGLRLDVAYCLPKWFLGDLRTHVQTLRPDFYLLGEVIHGNYNEFLGTELLDSVTNYECYKGLWSSHNDKNYFEIAHSLGRLFGDGDASTGVSQGHALYNFADNHDVDRVASVLTDPSHLFPLYGLLVSMPGTPSIYYGSEFAMSGRKTGGDDGPLRPDWPSVQRHAEQNPVSHLIDFLRELLMIRSDSPALRHGSFQQLHTAHQQLAFLRRSETQQVLAAVNASSEETVIPLQGLSGSALRSLFNHEEYIPIHSGNADLILPGYGTGLYEITE
ncbi:MAG: alpha-amylase family glycosyl hydrolase [Spirochaeta sp.]